jgi:glycosyltransferase involved in cell wall biosynthesis
LPYVYLGKATGRGLFCIGGGMNILIANKFYFNRGGDCIYSIGLEKMLLESGHDAAFFASGHSQNLPSKWSKYWVSEFSLKTPFRPFGDKETEAKFARLLNDFKPDILHLNNIHTQISPIIAEIAHNRGVKVIWTLHDHKLICPSYLCLNGKGEICEKCLGGNKTYCAKYRCIKNKFLHSFIAQKEAEKWNRERLEKCVDAFICPSKFLKQKMLQGGFSESKLHTLHNFIDIPKSFNQANQGLDNCYAYIGRLSKEKGIETLCSAAGKLPYKLKIAGTGPLENELREKYKCCKQIEFLGYQSKENVLQMTACANFTVCPSECYENSPLSVIESLCLGVPVLGANIGGIPELTDNLFESGNENDLKEKIEMMQEMKVGADLRVCPNSEMRVCPNSEMIEKFSPKNYLGKLAGIYGEAKH